MIHASRNEYSLRFFNCIELVDGRRLNSISYNLPSLAVGDLIHWGKQPWRVQSEGWTKLTQNLDLVRGFMMR